MQDKLITGVHLGSGGFLLIGVAYRAIVRTSIAYRLSIGQVGKFFARGWWCRLFARWAEIASAIRSSADKGVYAGDQKVRTKANPKAAGRSVWNGQMKERERLRRGMLARSAEGCAPRPACLQNGRN